jgi:hypothetical protein
MARVYATQFSTAVTSARDLVEINASSTSGFCLHAIEIAQSSDTDNENLALLFHRGTASGTGGSSATAAPIDPGDAAFLGSVEVNNTTRSTTGAIFHRTAFSVLSGYSFVWTPETRPQAEASGRIVVSLLTAPADELSMVGTVYFGVL